MLDVNQLQLSFKIPQYSLSPPLFLHVSIPSLHPLQTLHSHLNETLTASAAVHRCLNTLLTTCQTQRCMHRACDSVTAGLYSEITFSVYCLRLLRKKVTIRNVSFLLHKIWQYET